MIRWTLGAAAAALAALPAWAAEKAIDDPVTSWDHLWFELLVDIWVIGIVFGIAAIWMLVKFKAKSPDAVGSAPRLSRAQAAAWALIPAAVFMADDFFLSAKGWTVWNIYRRVPEGALEVKVTGYQWYWEFDYGNGVVSQELVVPVGQPVVLRMTAVDVIHSFFMPGYRVKEDVMPGRVTYVWFYPRKPQTVVATCTEYCGTAHAGMYTSVKSVPRAEYDAWIAAKAKPAKTS